MKTRLGDPTSCLPLAAGVLTQPSLHLLAEYCTYAEEILSSLSICVAIFHVFNDRTVMWQREAENAPVEPTIFKSRPDRIAAHSTIRTPRLLATHLLKENVSKNPRKP